MTIATAQTAFFRLFAIFLCAAALLAAPAVAQETPDAPPAPVAISDAANSDVERLLTTLEDEDARQRLIGDLRALLAAQAGGQAGALPDQTAAGGILAGASDRLAVLGIKLRDLFEELDSPGAILEKAVAQVRQPERRAAWLSGLAALGLALLAGIAGHFLFRVALARPRRSLETREVPGFWIRLPLLLARTVLDLLPIAAFAAAAYFTVSVVDPGPTARVVILAVVNAGVLARAAIAVVRLAVTPLVPSLRLIALADASAAYVFVWARRFIVILVYGYFLAEVLFLLGLSGAGHALLVKLLGLLVAAMTLVLVLQNKDPVAARIRDQGGTGTVAILRNRLADIWHVLAGFYLAGAYVIWVLEIEGGFPFVLRGTVGTLAVLLAAYLALRVAGQGLARLFRVGDELKKRFPGVDERVNLYLPVARRIVGAFIVAVAALAVLQSWGLNVLAFLGSEVGRDMTARVVSIAAIILVSLALWEAANVIITRYLEATGDDGATAVSARMRTLLPLARSALMVVIATIATLTVLAEVGVNIGPLIAGAGVVGLAVGFGAQTLVKDVITGAFILFEDAIAVGDVVTVAGITGMVEALSIRSIRLRDISGCVHTVPFSAVETVSNKTRDYSYYILNVGVAYREDTDQVIALMREVDEDLRADSVFGGQIMEPLNVAGVNSFEDSAVVIRARIKTEPGAQWRVGREYNRRMKQKFDAHDIEMPFPHQTIYFGVDRDGNAPPAPVRMVGPGDEGESG